VQFAISKNLTTICILARDVSCASNR